MFDVRQYEREMLAAEMAAWTKRVRQPKPLWKRVLNWLGL